MELETAQPINEKIMYIQTLSAISNNNGIKFMENFGEIVFCQ